MLKPVMRGVMRDVISRVLVVRGGSFIQNGRLIAGGVLTNNSKLWG